jgi:hypothetical protein
MPPPGLAIVPGGGLGMPAPVLAPDELRARNRERVLALQTLSRIAGEGGPAATAVGGRGCLRAQPEGE